MRISCSETIRILTILIVLIYGALCPHSLMAIDCTSDYIELNTQARIDSFQSDYGGGGTCDTVPGTLRIGGPDVVDLTPLSALITIRDQFQIRQTNNLADLEALSALTSVGGEKNDAAGSFDIFDNEALTSLNGLTGLVSIGGQLYVSENPALTSLDGLSALTRVGRIEILNNESLTDISGISAVISGDFPGSITVGGNDALTDIDDLSSLTSVSGGLSITHNYALVNLDGLSGLTHVGRDFDIRGNSSLKHIQGLSSLTRVTDTLQIIANDNLESLGGLSALTNVGLLRIKTNAQLKDLGGLSSLAGEILILEIQGNAALVNLNGLSALQSAHFLSVEGNSILTDCQDLVTLVDPIDDYEPGPGPSSEGIPDVANQVTIQNNSAGCNSVNEILGEVPLHELNAGLSDAWFNLQTNGQGFLIIVFPEIKQVFVAWFTYDTERPPGDVTAILGEAGHRWLTAQGKFEDNIAELILYVTQGGVFDSEEPKPGTDPYGELMLEFATCNSGKVIYDIPSIFQQGEVQIERIALDNVPLCYLLENQALKSNPADG